MSLTRFEVAQDPVWSDVLAELKLGQKTSHWMWFVFPQLRILGRSARARYFGLDGLDDARTYLAHPVLGPRLHDALSAVMASGVRDPVALLGAVDAMKFRSSMTLFACAAEDPAPFQAALIRFYGGVPDPVTIDILNGPSGPAHP